MTKQSMGYLVEDLRKKGYATFQPDPDDARAKRVILTPKGEAVVATLRQLSTDLEQKLSTQFGKKWMSGIRQKLAELDDFLTGT